MSLRRTGGSGPDVGGIAPPASWSTPSSTVRPPDVPRSALHGGRGRCAPRGDERVTTEPSGGTPDRRRRSRGRGSPRRRHHPGSARSGPLPGRARAAAGRGAARPDPAPPPAASTRSGRGRHLRSVSTSTNGPRRPGTQAPGVQRERDPGFGVRRVVDPATVIARWPIPRRWARAPGPRCSPGGTGPSDESLRHRRTVRDDRRRRTPPQPSRRPAEHLELVPGRRAERGRGSARRPPTRPHRVRRARAGVGVRDRRDAPRQVQRLREGPGLRPRAGRSPPPRAVGRNQADQPAEVRRRNSTIGST